MNNHAPPPRPRARAWPDATSTEHERRRRHTTASENGHDRNDQYRKKSAAVSLHRYHVHACACMLQLFHILCILVDSTARVGGCMGGLLFFRILLHVQLPNSDLFRHLRASCSLVDLPLFKLSFCHQDRASSP